eukprot:135825-Ditylum_brightwellii.AAC.1
MTAACSLQQQHLFLLPLGQQALPSLVNISSWEGACNLSHGFSGTVTEIGEKTFFVATVLRMRNDCCAIFGGAILALI